MSSDYIPGGIFRGEFVPDMTGIFIKFVRSLYNLKSNFICQVSKIYRVNAIMSYATYHTHLHHFYFIFYYIFLSKNIIHDNFYFQFFQNSTPMRINRRTRSALKSPQHFHRFISPLVQDVIYFPNLANCLSRNLSVSYEVD
jgi:hypothetical protein